MIVPFDVRTTSWPGVLVAAVFFGGPFCELVVFSDIDFNKFNYNPFYKLFHGDLQFDNIVYNIVLNLELVFRGIRKTRRVFEVAHTSFVGDFRKSASRFTIKSYYTN